MSSMSRSWTEFEAPVLLRAIDSISTFSNLTGFALRGAFHSLEHCYARDVLVAVNVPRQLLGLDAKGCPGDIDLLLVPLGDSLMADRAIGIEVKVVRPTMENPSRNANSTGQKQALGLVRDGFPFVGLAHICIPERLPDELHLRVPWMSTKFGPKGEVQMLDKHMNVDPFPLICAQRQFGRLRAMNLPREVGYKVLSVELSRDGQRFAGYNMNEEKMPLRNPCSSPALVDAVRQLCDRRADLFRRIRS
jgi:hypothetical protein